MLVNINIDSSMPLQGLIEQILFLYQIELMRASYKSLQTLGLHDGPERFCELVLKGTSLKQADKDFLVSNFTTFLQMQGRGQRNEGIDDF